MNGNENDYKTEILQKRVIHLKLFSKYLLLIDLISYTIFEILNLIEKDLNGFIIFYTILQVSIIFNQLVIYNIIVFFLFFSIYKNYPKLLKLNTYIYLILGMMLFIILLIYEFRLKTHSILLDLTMMLNIICGISRLAGSVFMLLLYNSMISFSKCIVI